MACAEHIIYNELLWEQTGHGVTIKCPVVLCRIPACSVLILHMYTIQQPVKIVYNYTFLVKLSLLVLPVMYFA